ncbi:MAG: MBOAT family O-acyltransferase, partial [Alphaproteobacteria bacterium]|nr:MBOAT family O-acyltransferase [Alphaproteobacteria bacterium]
FLNLSLLFYFKYFNFISSSLFENFTFVNVILPLGISFFTFEQISFLSDIYNKKTTIKSFSNYLFFITFFPRLIAGPIYYYRKYRDSIEKASVINPTINYINIGLYFFSIGLFKKVIIADSFSILADAYFSEPFMNKNFLDHWIGTLSYTFQIYFDFSGYSEMALGLGYLFGIKLPQNFNSPYKSASIIEFWQRWHITLSNFIKEYIYFNLGGNKYGTYRKYINIILTMTIAGLWHGAGYNFIVWGLLYGVLITTNHIIRDNFNINLPKILKILLTFLIVHLMWVIFRSKDLYQAFDIYKGLLNIDFIAIENIKNNLSTIFYLILVFLFCTILPNSFEFLHFNLLKNKKLYKFFGIIFGIICFLSVLKISKTDSFLYFNF